MTTTFKTTNHEEMYRKLVKMLGHSVLFILCPCDRTFYLEPETVAEIKERGLTEVFGLTRPAINAMTLRSKGRELVAFKF